MAKPASIYLVMDMENDLVHTDGPNGKGPYGEQVSQRRILANTQVALQKARAANVRVAYVRVGFSNDYAECPAESPIFSGARAKGIFKLGTWGTEVHPDIAPLPGDLDIVKHRVSPFYSTQLEAVLRAGEIRRIYCSGISTNAVVQAAVRDGHDRDFEMIVLEDCCCALTAEEHAAAMATMQRFCKVTTASEVTFD